MREDERSRSHAARLAELAELRRHLQDLPPHHDGGRRRLEERISHLEREIAATRADRGREDGR